MSDKQKLILPSLAMLAAMSPFQRAMAVPYQSTGPVRGVITVFVYVSPRVGSPLSTKPTQTGYQTKSGVAWTGL